MDTDKFYSVEQVEREIRSVSVRYRSLASDYNDLAGKIDPIVEECATLKNEISEEERHYNKLYQIAKNRANADREIRPKREKSGFRLLRLREDTLRTDKTSLPAIRMIVQTPYLEELTLEEVHALWDISGQRDLQNGLGVELLKMGEKVEKNSKIKRPYFVEFDLQPSIDPQKQSYWNAIVWTTEAPERYE